MAATAKNTAVQTALYKFVLINFDYLRKLFHTSQVYLFSERVLNAWNSRAASVDFS